MRLNFELNLVLHCPEVAVDLEKVFLEDFEESREVTLIELAGRSWKRRIVEAAARPLAPLM